MKFEGRGVYSLERQRYQAAMEEAKRERRQREFVYYDSSDEGTEAERGALHAVDGTPAAELGTGF